MSWFSSHEKSATRAVVAALQPLINKVQQYQGTSSQFWQDEYVLGFMYFSIGHHTRLATRGKLSSVDSSVVTAESFTILSNINGVELFERSIKLAQKQDAKFIRGSDDAATICFYSIGMLKNETDNFLVTKATELAKANNNGKAPKRHQVEALMVTLSLIKEVDSRFYSI